MRSVMDFVGYGSATAARARRPRRRQQHDVDLRAWQRRDGHRSQRQRLRRPAPPHRGGPRRSSSSGRWCSPPIRAERHQRAARRDDRHHLHRAGRRDRRVVRHHLRDQRQHNSATFAGGGQIALHHAERELHRRRAVHGHDLQGPGRTIRISDDTGPTPTRCRRTTSGRSPSPPARRRRTPRACI